MTIKALVLLAIRRGFIRVELEGREPMVAPLNGDGLWRSPTDERFRRSFAVEQGDLVQRPVASDGETRRNVFTLLADGLLRWAVTLTTPRLPRPVSSAVTWAKVTP